MNDYKITHDYMEIITGTTNILNPVYKEAAESVDKHDATGYGYLRNFVKSIDTLSKKGTTNDARITASKGNIKNFEGYDDIKFAIDFMSKNMSGVPGIAACKTVFSKLEQFSTQYATGYEKKAKIVMFEYDTALYVLVTSLSMMMANNVDVVSNGTDIKITKKAGKDFGVIMKTLEDYAKQLSGKAHKEYLETMLKAVDEAGPANYHESVITEGTVDDILSTIDVGITGLKNIGKFGVHLVKGIKSSALGIVPLIRSGMYLKYKKKADTINALDQQVQFIKMNVDQLKNMKNMDEKKKEAIIKKQEATIEAYKKKAEKLRAQLVETEKEVATAIDKENPQIKNNKADDDFVLESYEADYDPFAEEAKASDEADNTKKLPEKITVTFKDGDDTTEFTFVTKCALHLKEKDVQDTLGALDAWDKYIDDKAFVKDFIKYLESLNENVSDEKLEGTLIEIMKKHKFKPTKLYVGENYTIGLGFDTSLEPEHGVGIRINLSKKKYDYGNEAIAFDY